MFLVQLQTCTHLHTGISKLGMQGWWPGVSIMEIIFNSHYISVQEFKKVWKAFQPNSWNKLFMCISSRVVFISLHGGGLMETFNDIVMNYMEKSSLKLTYISKFRSAQCEALWASKISSMADFALDCFGKDSQYLEVTTCLCPRHRRRGDVGLVARPQLLVVIPVPTVNAAGQQGTDVAVSRREHDSSWKGGACLDWRPVSNWLNSVCFTNAPSSSHITAVGVSRSFVSPVPSWPYSLSPQQSTTPPVRRAQVCENPAVRAMTPAMELAGHQAWLDKTWLLLLYLYYFWVKSWPWDFWGELFYLM